MQRRPSRFWAFLLTISAAVSLALPIYYAAYHFREWGPFGNLIAWTTACVALFGIVTVAVSFVRSFLVPVLQDTEFPPRGDGNL
jgi:hypothetical protein